MVARTDGIGQFAVEGNFELDRAVVEALPIPGTNILSAHAYGMWVWARQARIVCRLPDNEIVSYFLKHPPVTVGENDRLMSQGQFEADKAIHAVSPSFCPKPHAWGQYRRAEPPTYFLLADFREIGQQPPDAIRFTAQLADFHKTSLSPTGQFGFHITTCHGKAAQLTDLWDPSWESLYGKQLAHTFAADKQKHPDWPEFEHRKRLVLERCVPRLLAPLQSHGRSIKPCLVHGNIWDQNTATDMETGEPFVFDGSAFFAHNEYELGNWRSPRHRLGSKTYIRNYKRTFPASEPEDDWDSRNLLYSLRFNTCAATLIPGSNYREHVFEDVGELCARICPDDLAAFKPEPQEDDATASAGEDGGDEEEEEEEDDDEEEEEEEEEEDDHSNRNLRSDSEDSD